MTVVRARKLLGKVANNLTDNQVLIMIKQVKVFADICAERINNRINDGSIDLYIK